MNERAIPFIQYLRPDGQRVPVFFDTTSDQVDKAKKIMAQGYVFEAEVLTTGEVSLTVTNDDGDIASQICPNGPGLEKHVEALVNDAFNMLQKVPAL